ncbi:YqiA/YcfP family alpha/beta fold hydrolase [Hahella ganghwensis]|uniref:YqiA/YcfP family alpha/beta fold hydrolase n=1 Tax=Hahella ganghwensis TaxID=286420 RepID=UPI000382DDF0|nr:YqiA/YcfP family alpha/beta fold hydrolase [Hahella ganghwensis]
MGHIIFSHGKESGPWGSKIRHLSELALKVGYTFETIDYQGMHSPDLRAEKLLKHLQDWDTFSPLILVGSSMGAYVSLVASHHVKVTGLFLLAPALGLPEYRQPLIAPKAEVTEVVHGWSDHLIPASTVCEWSMQHQCTLYLVNDGHRLQQALPQLGIWFYQFLDRLNRTSGHKESMADKGHSHSTATQTSEASHAATRR